MGGPGWTLEGFLDRMDVWIDTQQPSDDQRLIVAAWVFSRLDDPYQGVRRESGFPNLWYGVVPDSGDEHGRVVLCAYWIDESRRTVRCDNIATLGRPT